MAHAHDEITSGSEESRALGELVRAGALRLGFDAVGFADPAVRPDPAPLLAWLRDGWHAGMDYLARNVEARLDPNSFLPGVRSIICVALSYYHGDAPSTPSPERPRIARFAWGDDYHAIMRRRLHALEDLIHGAVRDTRSRIAVDTAPVLERHWAAQAGIGWIGRNGCLIAPALGSWIFLGEIFLDLPLPAESPQPSRCGRCTRCIDACPARALVAPAERESKSGGEIRASTPRPARLDARRCIAYLTIEHRGPFPDISPRIAPWLFGCDACQEACPWNGSARRAREAALQPRGEWLTWDCRQWAALDETAFTKLFARSALARAGYRGLRRNLAALRGSL